MPPSGGKRTDISALAANPGVFARARDAARYLISGVSPGAWMSPLQPLQPMAPESPPRAWDYPVGYNTNVQPRPEEPDLFGTLRGLADSCDVLRLVIDTRKDQMEALQWQIKPRVDSNAGEEDPRIKEIQAFLMSPDKEHDWSGWLRALLEDLFVIDAVSIYKRRTKGGGLYSLDLLDGATISIKIDETGRRPAPPDPAYQQIIKGVPKADYSTAELIYAPRNVRTHTVYGYSPVEQIQLTVNIAIRRALHQLGYYTDGNLTDGVFGLPEGWSPEQVKAFQAWWDGQHSGNLSERRKAKFLPGKIDYKELIQPALKDQYDEWLTRVICYAFSVSAEPFINKMNRATAETSHASAHEEGLAPTQNYVKRLIDRVIAEEFGAPDLEFAWVDDTEVDQEVAARIQDIKLKNGTLLINEARSQDGADPYKDVGDIPGMITATGFIALPTQDQLAAQEQAALDGAQNAQDDKPPKDKADKLVKKNTRLHPYP